jgi:16S rRNA (cytidine1402-2'-O)-methyltransferase
MQGTLYICATPIGNLEDITLRTLRILKEVDLIAAEDTRNSIKLLNHFEIKTPMTSYHEYNKYDKAKELVAKMLSGMSVAIITDAGTPCISDPGNAVVRACIHAGITVIPVPGCCAGVAAVSVSGFDAREFAFYGFLPREKKALREKLTVIAEGVPVAVLHESPFRIIELTECISETLPDAKMSVCCDLTKVH